MIRLRTLTIAGLGALALLLASVPAAAHSRGNAHTPAVMVTGGGWLLAPTPGTTTAATSRASFGLVAREVGSGPVRGHTEFQLHTGRRHLGFSSTSETSLVVTGCTATYSGIGREGRTRGFTFQVTATDAKVSGCSATKDAFAITITPPTGNSTPLYTLALTSLSRGSITIH
ncbi:MAG TPA: hypothetical protein VMW47_09515 [Verrucomicrobiae bacterium]|nr:hypothetical protein [Verrucomicrobiae bacterium]